MELNIEDMTAEQIADAKAQIEAWEARQQVKKLAWKPEVGEEYTYPCGDGNKEYYGWADDSVDNNSYKHGNVMNDELADYTIEVRAIIHQIHEWIDENDAERGGRFIVGERNYQIKYDALNGHVFTSRNAFLITSILPAFSSYDKSLQCIKDIGEENIKLLFQRYEIVRGEE